MIFSGSVRNLAVIGESGIHMKTLMEYTTVSRPQKRKMICQSAESGPLMFATRNMRRYAYLIRKERFALDMAQAIREEASNLAHVLVMCR